MTSTTRIGGGGRATAREGADCSVRVYDGSFRGHMCQKKAKVTVDGKSYCGVHDPEKVAARRAAQDAKWKAENDRWSKNYALQSAAQAMLNLLVESQTSIGGDWRERRDATILLATGRSPS